MYDSSEVANYLLMLIFKHQLINSQESLSDEDLAAYTHHYDQKEGVMNIEIKKEDIEFLVLLLEREHKTALVEQRHTSHYEYKEIVKARIAEIENLLSAMRKAS
jgi:hypothetical protein